MTHSTTTRRANAAPARDRRKDSAGETAVPWTQRIFAYGGFDYPFLVLVLVLLCIGVVMMFSASYVNAANHKASNYDAFFYLKRQAAYAVLGIIIMLLASKINLAFLRKAAVPVLLLAFALLVAVLVIPSKEDFKRWIYIGSFQFQPSEIAKIALILFFAYAMEKFQKPQFTPAARGAGMLPAKTFAQRVQRFWARWNGTILYVGVLALAAVLIYKENHVSGTVITLGIGAMMIFIGEQRIPLWFYFAATAAAVAVIIAVLKKPDLLPPHAAERIVSFLHREQDQSGDNWQTIQSLRTIGSGGLLGQGLGQSRQKYGYLPEPQSDFVFAIVCEELGFVRSFGILLLYVALVWRGFMIALHTKERFGSLLVMGIVLQVGLQTALNIGVVTATLPNTGIPLPFFTYGGTALVILLGEMGIVLAVSRVARQIKL
ncbi:MAG: FtsW/RodA/SpoVE family cell cycle protein [Oscillospiraceae bacterium]|jgi:cell division protein FtsW|nr:FtsW/RodA/SpoVE family cell cycle protein [Oscillospiraceae bacterium]